MATLGGLTPAKGGNPYIYVVEIPVTVGGVFIINPVDSGGNPFIADAVWDLSASSSLGNITCDINGRGFTILGTPLFAAMGASRNTSLGISQFKVTGAVAPQTLTLGFVKYPDGKQNIIG